MPRLRSRRGQSTAEYAVLFAIVIGAAIAMQQVVQGHLKGAMNQYANNYSIQAQSQGNVTFLDVGRFTNSNSNSEYGMKNMRSGRYNQNSSSRGAFTKR